MRNTFPHLADTYSYEYCLSKYMAYQRIIQEVNEERGINGWLDLVQEKKRTKIEVRTLIVSGKCLNILQTHVTLEDIEKIVRYVRANYITLEDIYRYCDETIPSEHVAYFSPDTAIEPLKKIWHSILTEDIQFSIATRRLSNLLKGTSVK